MATAILLAACGPSGTTPPATTGATAGPTGAAAASPAATAAAPSAAPPVFHVVGDEPVIPRAMVPGRAAILPGAVAQEAGTFHAWVIAFDEAPGAQDVHHLTSPDAVTWSEVADPSLEGLSAGLGKPGAFPTSVLPGAGGWVMYYSGTVATEAQGWEIRRATAPGPDGPWIADAEPVLRRGPAGAWDSGGLDFPLVLALDGGFVMLYSGQDRARPDAGSIGLATSPDGITWAKHDDPATTDAAVAESDPVIEPGLCGGFDARAVHQPRVIVDGDRLVMAYAGWGQQDTRSRIGLAASDGLGVTWSCLSPSPALDTSALPSGFVHTLAAFRRNERLTLLVEWFAREGTDVWLAEAGTLP